MVAQEAKAIKQKEAADEEGREDERWEARDESQQRRRGDKRRVTVTRKTGEASDIQRSASAEIRDSRCTLPAKTIFHSLSLSLTSREAESNSKCWPQVPLLPWKETGRRVTIAHVIRKVVRPLKVVPSS